jgi:ferredoxin-NADP reductase
VVTVAEVIDETPRARTLVLNAPHWPGHRAGQHVDVRLVAEDGYQAQRSYSIASAPEETTIALTVERLDDGEV